jgi:hypothetical protein
MAKKVEHIVADIFMEMADKLEKGPALARPKIAVTGLGSEHGEENIMAAAKAATAKGIDVSYIGSLEAEGVRTVKAEDEKKAHEAMEKLLDEKKVDGAVTMHYPFPIGVSTVGRVITPAEGKEMFIATTTGTSATDRTEAMVRNAIYGIITAKSCGIDNPKVGILNIDGARQTELILKKLAGSGYPINFAESSRADGGCILRGNDVIKGTADVLVCDSLTGNVIIKMLSAYSTGGSYEAMGYGYGPGIGEDYDRLVLIISRASGTPLVANAISFAADLVEGRVFFHAAEEMKKANQAGLKEICSKAGKTEDRNKKSGGKPPKPPKEVVTADIAGIEVMDLEDGVELLWRNGIYAEDGMGCTGPVILVSDGNFDKARDILKKEGYIG